MAETNPLTSQKGIVGTAIGVAILLATVFAVAWAWQKGKAAGA